MGIIATTEYSGDYIVSTHARSDTNKGISILLWSKPKQIALPG
jgi:hypothetical protein